MATEKAMADPHIVSAVLRHLSDMKYRSRRQYGPDQPVEFLEFRPTLVPSILVNKLFCDEGTSILWRRYPHLPALGEMPSTRRQYYANHVQHVFLMTPPPGRLESLEFLRELAWPSLKSLELEVDFVRHGHCFASMLHAGLENLEISGFQSGDSRYFCETALPSLLKPCENLKSLRIGQETMLEDDPQHVSTLFDLLDEKSGIRTIEIKSTNFLGKDALFTRLSQREGLEGLELDLDPGLALLPLLSGPSALPSPFSSLKRVWLMCYPEVALALPKHLNCIEELQLDIARIPNQLALEADHNILDDVLTELLHCGQMRLLKVGIGMMAEDFPSSSKMPGIAGHTLVNLARSCTQLEDINLFVTEPFAIDGISVSGDDFDAFCKGLPKLRNLNLKFHPATATPLEHTALPSLGKHCTQLEILGVKIPFQLPTLPVSNTIPHIVLNGEASIELPTVAEPLTTDRYAVGSLNQEAESTISGLAPIASSSPRASSTLSPLFPRLQHLAIARPKTDLVEAVEVRLNASSSLTSLSSHPNQSAAEFVDPDTEENLVRTWAHPLLEHFPHLEILEAWGDWTGQDNESLNYFLPREEILASTWEFLSGVEQDLWEDVDAEESVEEGESWRQSWESTEDWEKASLINEFVSSDDIFHGAAGVEGLALFDEEPEGMMTPGRTMDEEKFFTIPEVGKQDDG